VYIHQAAVKASTGGADYPKKQQAAARRDLEARYVTCLARRDLAVILLESFKLVQEQHKLTGCIHQPDVDNTTVEARGGIEKLAAREIPPLSRLKLEPRAPIRLDIHRVVNRYLTAPSVEASTSASLSSTDDSDGSTKGSPETRPKRRKPSGEEGYSSHDHTE
jgi:hypothetical protein